jgi:hypothetical protein
MPGNFVHSAGSHPGLWSACSQKTEWPGRCWNQILGRAVGLDDQGNGFRPAAIGPNHDTGTFYQAAQPPKRHRTAFASLYHAAAEIGSTVHVICRAASDSLHPGRLSRLIRARDNPLVSSGRLQTHVCPSPGVRGFTVPLCLSHVRLEVASPQVTFPQQDPGTVESLAIVPQCLSDCRESIKGGIQPTTTVLNGRKTHRRAACVLDRRPIRRAAPLLCTPQCCLLGSAVCTWTAPPPNLNFLNSALPYAVHLGTPGCDERNPARLPRPPE